MASINSPGSHKRSAVATSTVRLNPKTDPNALNGSPARALPQASAKMGSVAAPQGLLCFITDTAGLANPRTMSNAASKSNKLLYESSLPLSCRAETTLALRADGSA